MDKVPLKNASQSAGAKLCGVCNIVVYLVMGFLVILREGIRGLCVKLSLGLCASC